MTSPSSRPEPAPAGLLLVKGPRPEVRAWAARTVVPVVVVPLPGWTAVVPRGASKVGAPYDDAALVAAARPLPARAAPGLGFFEIDGRAVLTVHGPGRRRTVRWVVWDPELGLLRPPGLDLAGPGEVVTTAGAPADVRDELVDLLHETRVAPRRMLTAVMATLGLPGARLVAEPAQADRMDGAEAVSPQGRQVGWFEDAVKDSVRLRRELGALP